MARLSPHSLHILCVGVESSVIAYILAAKDLEISLDACQTMREAHQKMASSSYQAYIIDLNLSSTAFELAQEIRKKEGKECFIAMISRGDQEDYFPKFTESSILDEKLNKPVDLKQVDQLLVKIKQRYSPLPPAATNKLKDIKRQYESTIPQKLKLLEDLMNALQQHPDALHLKELKDAVHKIAGSAGSYGFSPVSTLCKEVDLQISERLANGLLTDSKWLSSLDVYLKKIKVNFLSTDLTREEPVTSLSNKFLYVVDHDVNFLKFLEDIKEQYSLELLVESDPEKARALLQSSSFNPSVLITSQKFPSSRVKGLDLIETLRQKPNLPPTVFTLILEEDSIDIRIEALQKGVDCIFRKPVHANVFLKAMKDVLESKVLKRVKVLVLDDDIDFCNFMTVILSEIGFIVRTISDSPELFHALDDFKPHILLLDLVLPKYDGLNLLRILRQDIAYKDLAVVIVTSGEEAMTRLSAYSAKADDILFKPLNIDILQKRLLYLAEKRVALEEMLDEQDSVSQIDQKTLQAQLNKYLAEPVGHPYYLALFEVDHFPEWLEQKGNRVMNKLLISINEQLKAHIDLTMQCFPYSLSKFAVIFDEKDLSVIERKMQNLLSKIQEKESLQKIVFNCSIILISKTYGEANQILQAGEQCLIEAREKHPAPIRMVVLLPEDDAPSKKNIVLIDSDEELLKILKTAFESHGVFVKTFTEGGEALKVLLACKPHRLPSLIVAERRLPDMDGMKILSQLKAHFNIPIPFYFLTVFSPDEDVSKELSQGALECIEKPFNLSFLMQKALKEVFTG